MQQGSPCRHSVLQSGINTFGLLLRCTRKSDMPSRIVAGDSVFASTVQSSGQAHLDLLRYDKDKFTMLVEKALHVNRLDRG